MKNKMKALVVGHFGFGEELLNGQTIKTKVVTKELEKEYGVHEILKIDTHGCKKMLFKFPFQLLKGLSKANNAIIFPAYNGLRIIAPLLVCGNVFFYAKLHYVVIGGWLPEYLVNKPFLRSILYRFDYIYVETSAIKNALVRLGFNNVVVMRNCKELKVVDEAELTYNVSTPFRFCTFSRIRKEKGIEDAVSVIKEINNDFGTTVVSLDIFGQIDNDQREWFAKIEKEFPYYMNYKGMVPFQMSTDVLKNYFALLFPTYHDGEGFAGTLIDALAAGIPVIASDWKYNSEIVIEGKTGVLYPSRDNKKLKEKIVYAITHVTEWNEMKKNCIKLAFCYQPKNVVTILKEKLE